MGRMRNPCEAVIIKFLVYGLFGILSRSSIGMRIMHVPITDLWLGSDRRERKGIVRSAAHIPADHPGKLGQPGVIRLTSDFAYVSLDIVKNDGPKRILVHVLALARVHSFGLPGITCMNIT